MHNVLRVTVVIFISLFLFACSSLKPKLSPENEHVLKSLISSLSSCYTTKLLQKKLPTTPLYSNTNGQCVPADKGKQEIQQLYTSNSCSGEPIPYRFTSYEDYCKEIIVPSNDRLGNAAVWAGTPSAWTLNPPSALGLSVRSIANNHQPYMMRTRYKSAQVRDVHKIDAEDENSPEVVTLRGLGQCDLEMRIFKKDPSATNLKPLIAFHGGGWSLRSSPYLGFESVVSHFTEKGFVVFTPFYRLSSMSNGNFECNHAPWHEIVSDAEDALAWIQTNGKDYGVNEGKVYVLGGSAGGHLATWLTTHKKESIARTLLFYPPTDFEAYIQLARDSEDDLRGEATIKEFLDIEDVETVDLQSEKVRLNSFPQIIVQDPQSFPPIMAIHGVADGLVPSSQSVRLCNAYNGDIENGPAKNDGGDPASGTYSREYACGAHGKLYLLAEAKHSLDACVKHLSCPTGSEASQKDASVIIGKAIEWLDQ